MSSFLSVFACDVLHYSIQVHELDVKLMIRVMLVDDHRVLVEGLLSLLQREPGFDVVSVAHDGPEALRQAQKLQPDVAVVDIGLPSLSGVDVTRRICGQVRKTRVLGLSMHSDASHIRAMLAAGADGYLLKSCVADELFDAIRSVAMRRRYVSASLSNVIIEDYVRRANDANESSENIPLTVRERDVLRQIAEGDTSKKIAAALNLSVSTVDTHRRHISEKLGIHSIAELTKYAIRHGMTTLDK